MDDGIAAQFEAQQLLYRATFSMDSADWEHYITCFAEDAVLARPSDPDNPFVGRDAIMASLVARPPQRTAHLITNTFFTNVTPTTMTATSRVLKLSGDHAAPLPAPADPSMPVGTFVDDLVLVDGAWLIAKRQGSIELKASWPPVS